jgi:hypothetical protein
MTVHNHKGILLKANGNYLYFHKHESLVYHKDEEDNLKVIHSGVNEEMYAVLQIVFSSKHRVPGFYEACFNQHSTILGRLDE